MVSSSSSFFNISEIGGDDFDILIIFPSVYSGLYVKKRPVSLKLWNILVYVVIICIDLFQVCIWSDTHSSTGRLACHASGPHWFYADGILLKFYKFVRFLLINLIFKHYFSTLF